MLKLYMVLGFLLCNSFLYSQPKVNLRIIDVVESDGKIFVSVFNSELSYNKREVFQAFTINPLIVSTNFYIDLPAGEYVFSIYQDSNHNGKLDCNLLGIPKERFGFSNYEGKSIPGDFQKHKIRIVDGIAEVPIRLVKI